MQKDKKKKQIAFLVLVGFIFSIVCLGVWWFFGKTTDSNDSLISSKKQAFNTKLPDANLKENGKNKFEVYMQAEKDSAKLKELEKKDSLDKRWFNPGPPDEEIFSDDGSEKVQKKQPVYHSKTSVEQNERKVNDRLDKLYKALNSSTDPKSYNEYSEQPDKYTAKYDNNINQLENMLHQVQTTGSDSDVEMKQIAALLDKVLDVQHPERLKDNLSKINAQQKDSVSNITITSSDSLVSGDQNAFFGFQEDPVISTNGNMTIAAVVHQDQLLQENSVIKLRLLQDIYINGTRIPKDNFLFGECNLGDQRLTIQFHSIAYDNVIYPVKLTAFDTDGTEGVYIPGAISRDVTKQGINDAIQQMQLTSLNPSVGAQAASAGIQTVQNLLSKKIKRVQVTVKAGHKLLLKIKQ